VCTPTASRRSPSAPRRTDSGCVSISANGVRPVRGARDPALARAVQTRLGLFGLLAQAEVPFWVAVVDALGIVADETAGVA